jgi:hypothetical protein
MSEISSEPSPSDQPVGVAAIDAAAPKPTKIARWIAVVLLLLVLAVAGTIAAVGGVEPFRDLISPALVEVTGKVTYNGKPMSDGFIQTYYERKGWMGALGLIEKDGTFRLRTNGEPGAFSGSHRVIVSWMDNNFPPQSLLPERYGDPRKTPFVVHISRSGENILTLDLVDAE